MFSVAVLSDLESGALVEKVVQRRRGVSHGKATQSKNKGADTPQVFKTRAAESKAKARS
jgi:hypothetical protein